MRPDLEAIARSMRHQDIPRGLRPRCKATTKAGTRCNAQALVSGYCVKHDGLGVPYRDLMTQEDRRQATANLATAPNWLKHRNGDWMAEG